MVNIKLIAVGKLKESFFKDACAEYEKRLGGYCVFKCIEIPESSLEKEADAVIKYLGKGACVVALCVEGRQISSEELAKFMADKTLGGISEFDFIIGGSTGMHDRLKNLADFRISFSKMTFPHHLFRVMLLEQIYRSFKINEGSSYHK